MPETVWLDPVIHASCVVEIASIPGYTPDETEPRNTCGAHWPAFVPGLRFYCAAPHGHPDDLLHVAHDSEGRELASIGMTVPGLRLVRDAA